jgi:hypothetical protein
MRSITADTLANYPGSDLPNYLGEGLYHANTLVDFQSSLHHILRDYHSFVDLMASQLLLYAGACCHKSTV